MQGVIKVEFCIAKKEHVFNAWTIENYKMHNPAIKEYEQ